MKQPKVQPGNFGFCDLCIKTATKGKYEVTVYVDRASIKAGKMKAINDALQKMQGVIKLVSGTAPVIHSAIVVEYKDFISNKYIRRKRRSGETLLSGSDIFQILQQRKDSVGITCFFIHKEIISHEGETTRGTFILDPEEQITIGTKYSPEEIKFTTVHEFGHLMGLAKNHSGMFTNEGEAREGHCTVPNCTMRDVVGTTMNDGILNINNSGVGLTHPIIWKNLKKDSGFRLVRKKLRSVRKKFRLRRKI